MTRPSINHEGLVPPRISYGFTHTGVSAEIESDSPGGGAEVTIQWISVGSESHLGPVTGTGCSSDLSTQEGVFRSISADGKMTAFPYYGIGDLYAPKDRYLGLFGYRETTVGDYSRTAGYGPITAAMPETGVVGILTRHVSQEPQTGDFPQSYSKWSPPTESVLFPLSLHVADTGKGYGDTPVVSVSQQSGVAKASPVYDGKVLAIGATSRGSGYASPPAVTLEAADGQGTAGTATATIAGPVAEVAVTSTGSGYRLPPRVRFSGPGISAKATCTLDENGGVKSVSVIEGGRYRNSPPSVSFEPISQVSSLTIGSGGSGYTSAPEVFIGGGGGSNATATSRIRAEVVSIELTSPGSGYTSAPTVTISGGDGSGATAIAGISFSSGQVTGITLQNHGDFYQSAPQVSITGGGGRGATAVAKISGYVDQLTIMSGGEDFVVAPKVLFIGGGGSGASATASLGSFGSGAAATSRISGSILFCTHNSDSSGLQAEPVVTVDHSTNHDLSVLQQKLEDDEITVEQFDEQSKAVTAVLKSRIAGKVTGFEVVDGGSGYKQVNKDDDVPDGINKTHAADRRICGAATLDMKHAVISGTDYYGFDYIRYPGKSRELKVSVSGGGSVSSVSLVGTAKEEQTEKNQEYWDRIVFWKKPDVLFIDSISATPFCCVNLVGSAISESSVISPSEDTPDSEYGSYAAKVSLAVIDGMRTLATYPRGSNGAWTGTTATQKYGPASIDLRGFAGPDVIAAVGEVWGFVDLMATGAYPLDELRNGHLVVSSDTNAGRLYYDPVPDVVVEDEVGSGVVMKMTKKPDGSLAYGVYRSPRDNQLHTDGSLDSFSMSFGIASPGSGHTLNLRPKIVGGTPACWNTPAAASATLTQNGGVVSIEVSDQGAGYMETPDVVIHGGGGSGASATAVVSGGKVVSVRVKSPGRGYTSTPSVTIVDRDKPFDRTKRGQVIQGHIDKYGRPLLINYRVEYCLQASSWQWTIDSPSMLMPYKRFMAVCVPFFDDNVYVEGAQWETGALFSCRNAPNPPTLPVVEVIGDSERKAVLRPKITRWSSEVFSGSALKTVPEGE